MSKAKTNSIMKRIVDAVILGTDWNAGSTDLQECCSKGRMKKE